MLLLALTISVQKILYWIITICHWMKLNITTNPLLITSNPWMLLMKAIGLIIIMFIINAMKSVDIITRKRIILKPTKSLQSPVTVCSTGSFIV